MTQAEFDRDAIDVTLVRKLIETQFPQWAALTIRPVAVDGWDNRTFHLGDDMKVRLPSAAAYAPQTAKEHTFLPRLAPHLPVEIPVPVAVGAPGQGYPWAWSVWRWIEGETAARERIGDLAVLARDVGGFLAALQRVDATGGPPAGPDNFFRGGDLKVYEAEARHAIAVLGEAIDGRLAHEIMDRALASQWDRSPVWVHGDIAWGNLLLCNGKLRAVIDFGSSAVGDPACDLAIAWTLFEGESRTAFAEAVGLDDATWDRGRGWTLWKALIVAAQLFGTNPKEEGNARRDLAAVFEEYRGR